MARRADLARIRDLVPYPRTAALALVLALGAIGNQDYADELAREADAKERLPDIVRSREYEPCPRVSPDGRPLRIEVAYRNDGMWNWRRECHYLGQVHL